MSARFVEDATIAFAMFCDENSLTLDEGRELAEHLADELAHAAESRAVYLPATHLPSQPPEEQRQ